MKYTSFGTKRAEKLLLTCKKSCKRLGLYIGMPVSDFFSDQIFISFLFSKMQRAVGGVAVFE